MRLPRSGKPLKVREASKGFSPTQKDTHCKHGRKTAEEKKKPAVRALRTAGVVDHQGLEPRPTGYEPAALTN